MRSGTIVLLGVLIAGLLGLAELTRDPPRRANDREVRVAARSPGDRGAASSPTSPLARRVAALSSAASGAAADGGGTAAVAGRVCGPRGPVPSAEVCVVDVGCRHVTEQRVSTSTAGDGKFELPVPAQGRCFLAVRKAGFEDAFVGPVDPGAPSIDIYMRPGRDLMGRVVGGIDRQAVAGARVVARALANPARDLEDVAGQVGAASGTLFPRSVATRDDGTFMLDGLAAGQHELFVEHEDWPSARMSVGVDASTGTDPLCVTLEAGSMRGTCWRGGLPVAGVRLLLRGARGPGHDLEVSTDEQGRFLFARIAPGWLVLHVAGPGAASDAAWTAMRDVEVHVGRETAVDLELPGSDPIELRGRFELLGRPLDRASLRLEPDSAAVEVASWSPIEVEVVHGAFRAVLPAAGRCRYRVIWEGGEHSGEIDVERPASDVVIEIPTGELRVWLVDEHAGPVRQAARLLRLADDGRATVVREAGDATTTDEAGMVRFTCLGAGTYAVACGSGADSARSDAVTLSGDCGSNELVFVVRAR
ncbi:MAG: carboxypeptidase-like regulatory domain-containing protein [Planctomycetota bacterium]